MIRYKKESNIDISIIIVNYNLAKEIEDCINSILKIKCEDINIEIIVVDNNSPDRAILETENKFKSENINFYYLKDNLGFGKACNYGYTMSSGSYICFLNPDTLVNENIFAPIMNYFNKNESVGIIGPSQQVRSSIFDFSAGFYPNLVFEAFHLFGIGVFLEGLIMKIYSKILPNRPLKVDWILGACIFIRASLFEAVNGFDPDFFMFFEEVDLCKRVSDSKKKIIYYPELKINHIGSVSGKKNYFLYTVRTYSSKYLYISKHYNFIYKFLMKIFLYTELVSQSFIWGLLYFHNSKKSTEKIKAFLYLFKTKMRNLLDCNENRY